MEIADHYEGYLMWLREDLHKVENRFFETFQGLMIRIDNKIMLQHLSRWQMNKSLQKRLENMGIAYVFQLVQLTEARLLKCQYIGRKKVEEIKLNLERRNLRLGVDKENDDVILAGIYVKYMHELNDDIEYISKRIEKMTWKINNY